MYFHRYLNNKGWELRLYGLIIGWYNDGEYYQLKLSYLR